MNELAKLAFDAHGGLDRWKRFTRLSVHGINGGLLWGAKGKAGVLPHIGERRSGVGATLGESHG